MSILKSGLWTVLLGVFVNTAAQAYLYATLPSVGRSIGLVETQTGLILGGGGLLGMLTAPAWGYLSERWGRRPVLVLAMSAVGVSPLVLARMLGGVAAALAAISVFLVVLGARSIQAAFGSALIPVSQASIADITPSSDRNGGMGLLGAAISVGTIGGSALVWVIGGMSSVAGFALIAASAVLAFLLALVFLPEPERHVAKERDASTVPCRKLWPYFTITAFAMTAYSIVQQWADAVRRSASLDSEKLINALEDHSYSLLKGPQQWRAFDHQNVQSIYAVRVKPRSQIMQDPLKQDYFEIIHRMDGEAAAPSHDEWQQQRGEQLTLQ